MIVSDALKSQPNKFSDNPAHDIPKSQISLNHPIIKNALKNVEQLSFEETHKAAYSHGLEAIYSLETVDIKTVRRLSESQPPPQAPKKVAAPVVLQDQLEFDFGSAYRGWMEPFIVKEPIQILNLSKQAEKCLIDNGKGQLRHLIEADLRSFVFFKGMGQGHLDEIKQKLTQYLEGHSLKQATKVDFASWMKTLIAAQDRKRCFVLLEQYELTELVTLTPAEGAEMRRLTPEKRQQWIAEMVKIVDERGGEVRNDFATLMEVFVKPWIRARGGYATRRELEERFMQVSEDPRLTPRVLAFLTDLFLDRSDYTRFLVSADADLFCADAGQVDAYQMIVNQVNSYFYQPQVSYRLQDLIAWIERELAAKWLGFPDTFLEKLLRLSPRYRIRKAPDGKLHIRLS